MKIEILVIGNEVLSGFTVNTNAAFIGQELLKAGYLISRQTTLPDREDLLEAGMEEALDRCDLVIATGGLGPTLDDVSRKIAAKLFDSDFRYDEEIAKDLAERFGKDLATLKDQATVPSKAKILQNSVGTAPGFIFERESKALIMLPGVPNEMKPMLVDQAVPYLKEAFPLEKRRYRKMVHLFELPELAVDPLLRELDKKYPDVEFSIYPALGLLSVHFSVLAENEEQAGQKLAKPLAELETKFATNCYSSSTGAVEEAVQHIFVENQWTLSIAESCTGGSVASRLTQLPGASDYFLGSVVSYANSVKTELLGVPEELICRKGAVSEEVVSKMVEGIVAATGSDFGLAVSGVAGPTGGSEEKPVGTVWCAVCRKGEKPHTWRLRARGSRQMIITRSVNSLLSNLLQYAKETSLL